MIDGGKLPALAPYFPTLNSYFTKGGVTFPYNGFGEPWRNAQGTMVPGWEIFCVGGAPISHPLEAGHLKIEWVDIVPVENVDCITGNIARLFIEETKICMIKGDSSSPLKSLELASGLLTRLKYSVAVRAQVQAGQVVVYSR